MSLWTYLFTVLLASLHCIVTSSLTVIPSGTHVVLVCIQTVFLLGSRSQSFCVFCLLCGSEIFLLHLVDQQFWSWHNHLYVCGTECTVCILVSWQFLSYNTVCLVIWCFEFMHLIPLHTFILTLLVTLCCMIYFFLLLLVCSGLISLSCSTILHNLEYWYPVHCESVLSWDWCL